MTAKDYLSQIWMIDDEINEKIRYSRYLRMKAESCRSPEVTGMPRTGGTKEKISEAVIKIVDLQMYINIKIDELVDMMTRITQQIEGVRDSRSKNVLSARYLRRAKWEEIEKDLRYEKSYLMRLHKRALKEFEKTYPEIKKMRPK